MKFAAILPCIDWVKAYQKSDFVSDGLAAIIVTIMLIPQSLAYALLAGLPAQVGLYASILPLIAYAIFGTSKTLSVGPVAVASLMTAAVIQGITVQQAIDPLIIAVILALLSGCILFLMGLLQFGFIANLLSHPVISGFITASGLIIALSQLKHILGVSSSGDNIPELLHSLSLSIGDTNIVTLCLGVTALFFLFWSRRSSHKILARMGPVIIVILTTLVSYAFDLVTQGLALVGDIPAGMPTLTLPEFDITLWMELLVPAILISIIGYVESVSIGKTLAAKRKQKINPNQELVGLGAANMASAISGGFPVTGGFSRSAVNFDAGAVTQAASVYTAIGIAAAAFTLTGLLALLPKATLAATIIVAVLSLVDLSILKKAWRYSISDFMAVFLTMVITLLVGVEVGVMCGVLASILLHIYKTSKPHIAEVGEVAGTEHFRNIMRHVVATHPSILSLRIDESLYFVNASYLEDEIFKKIDSNKNIKHLILMCTAINEIDMSALDVLVSINHRLKDLNISFNLSEVKGPVMDTLKKSTFQDQLNGQIFLSQHIAVEEILNQVKV